MTLTEEAQLLLTRAYARFLQGVQAVAGARAAADTALTHGRQLITDEARCQTHEGLRKAVQAGILKPDRGPSDTDAVLSLVVEKAGDHQLSSLQAVIDASLIIFMHSLLEAGIVDLCRTTMILNPDAWAARVDSSEVQLRQLRGRTYEELLRDKLGQYANDLQRIPLPKNVQRLLGVLQPGPGELNDANFTFSIERLKELDALRHKIVHETGPRAVDGLDDQLRYLQVIFFRFAGLVMLKHGMVLDDQVLRQAVSRYPAAGQ